MFLFLSKCHFSSGVPVHPSAVKIHICIFGCQIVMRALLAGSNQQASRISKHDLRTKDHISLFHVTPANANNFVTGYTKSRIATFLFPVT